MRTLGVALLLALSVVHLPLTPAAQAAGPTGWDRPFAPALQPTSRPAAAQPAGPVVVRVYYADQADLATLARELDIWEVNHEERYLVALVKPARYVQLVSAGYRLEIDPEQTRLLNQPLVSQPGQTNGIPNFPCYRTVEETYTTTLHLAATYPTLARVITIGSSWEKVTSGGLPGYDLLVLKLTNQSVPGPKPKFFLMAEIHARELTTAEMAVRYAEYLLSHYGTDPDITWLLDLQEVHILVMTNPDGRKHAETGEWWRKNTDSASGCTDSSSWGTDLNRNSSFAWGDAGTDPCDELYQGPAPASEPETQALQNYVASIFPDQRGPGDTDPPSPDATGVFVTLHAYGNDVLYPWGWTSNPAPNVTQLRTLGRKFGFFNRYQVCASYDSDCMYPTTGTSDDWAYGNLGVAAYTWEMGTTFFQACSTFENTIVPGNMPALIYAAKAARRPYQTPAGPESIQVSVPIIGVTQGAQVQLTATANDTRYYSNGWGDEPSQNIAAARYSVDAPSWLATIFYPMTAIDGVFNQPVEAIQATVNTAGWQPGRHTIYVESQDASGNWGVPSAVFLWIPAPDTHTWTIAKTASAPVIGDGSRLTYTLSLTHTSLVTATHVVVTDALPAGVTFAAASEGGLLSGNVVTWALPQVPPDGTLQLTLSVTPTGIISGTSLVNARYGVTSDQTPTPRWGQPVTVTVRGQPGINLTPSQMSLSLDPGQSGTRQLTITNPGTADLHWSLNEAPAAAWLGETPATGTVPPGTSGNVAVTFTTVGLASGRYSTALQFTGNAPGQGKVAIPVTLVVRGPTIQVAASRIDLSLVHGTAYTQGVAVANAGAANLNWSLSTAPTVTWLEVTPVVGTVPPGETSALQARFSAVSLSVDVYTTTLRFESNDLAQSLLSVPVTLTVTGDCVPAALVDVTWQPELPHGGHPVTFAAEVGGSMPVTVTWSFNDGSQPAAGPTVTHSFPALNQRRTYIVSTTAHNACGQEDGGGFVTVVPYNLYLPAVPKSLTP
jgi:carboxypeptidase T